MSARLESRGVSVVRSGRTILQHASVVVAQGQLTAILGPNGSGKSTLLRVLAGLWLPSDGSVELNGTALGLLPRRETAQRVAFLPQDTRCDFAFTVEELVAMGRHPHRRWFGSDHEHDRRAIEAAMTTCDLAHLRHRTVDRLSGGERQRAALARCLASAPEIVLLDEPTAHLDVRHALTVLDLCRSLADSGQAVAITTHDLSMVSPFATHAVVLSDGRMVASGPFDQVVTPDICRRVFAVDAEVVNTSAGRAAFVFSRFVDGSPHCG